MADELSSSNYNLSNPMRRKLRKKEVKRDTGVLSDADASRMARGSDPKLFGIDPEMLPVSMPDPEEIARAARRRALSRRRGGRMSTILTGGLGSASQPLGG